MPSVMVLQSPWHFAEVRALPSLSYTDAQLFVPSSVGENSVTKPFL